MSAAVVALVVGCQGERPEPSEPSPAPVSAVILNVERDTILRGATLQLRATLRDAVGNTLDDRQVAWSSSNPLLANVRRTGEVHAIGLGVATITAASEGKTDSATITLAARVVVSRRLPTTFLGDTTALTATMSDADGVQIPGDPDEWISSNERVATVTDQGIVTGVSAGAVTVRATRSGGIGTVELVVLDHRLRPNRELGYLAGGAENLHRIGLDGTGRIVLTDPLRTLAGWDWSPDGERIAVSYAPGGLFTLNADGGDERELVPDAGRDPRWSPDGRRILLVRGTPAELYVVDADGTNLTALTDMGIGLQGAEWSPDGRRIGAHGNGCGEFWLMDADGSHRVRLEVPAGIPSLVCNHAWSPDGKRIAFNTAGQLPNGLWVVSSEGTNPRSVSGNCNPQGECSGERVYVRAAWSPDGRRLAYISYLPDPPTMKVHVLDLVQQKTTEFDAGEYVDFSLDWSPDGTRLAFSGRKTEPPGWAAVVVSGADGSGQVAITGDETSYLGFWRP